MRLVGHRLGITLALSGHIREGKWQNPPLAALDSGLRRNDSVVPLSSILMATLSVFQTSRADHESEGER